MSESEFAVNHPLRRRLPGPDEWSSALDKQIAEAEKRGDFTNLPGHGKPIEFAANPLTGEVDLGLGLLKGAGYAPGWIELDKQVRAKLDELVTSRTETAIYLASLPEQIAPETIPAPTPRRSWWQTLLHGSRANRSAPEPIVRIDRATAHARAFLLYLERALEIDKLISDYNASIPRDLWHLERPRLTAEQARRDFEAAVAEAVAATEDAVERKSA